MNRCSRTAVAVPAHATRRNTRCDRKAGSGSGSVRPGQRRALEKRGGKGHANWGRPGDELCDELCDKVVDCTEHYGHCTQGSIMIVRARGHVNAGCVHHPAER